MPDLKIPPGQAILLLNEKVNEIETMRRKQQGLDYYDFVGWCSTIWSMIDEMYQADDMHPEDIRIIGLPTCSCSSSMDAQRMLLEVYKSRLLDYMTEIQDSMKNTE